MSLLPEDDHRSTITASRARLTPHVSIERGWLADVVGPETAGRDPGSASTSALNGRSRSSPQTTSFQRSKTGSARWPGRPISSRPNQRRSSPIVASSSLSNTTSIVRPEGTAASTSGAAASARWCTAHHTSPSTRAVAGAAAIALEDDRPRAQANASDSPYAAGFGQLHRTDSPGPNSARNSVVGPRGGVDTGAPDAARITRRVGAHDAPSTSARGSRPPERRSVPAVGVAGRRGQRRREATSAASGASPTSMPAEPAVTVTPSRGWAAAGSPESTRDAKRDSNAVPVDPPSAHGIDRQPDAQVSWCRRQRQRRDDANRRSCRRRWPAEVLLVHQACGVHRTGASGAEGSRIARVRSHQVVSSIIAADRAARADLRGAGLRPARPTHRADRTRRSPTVGRPRDNASRLLDHDRRARLLQATFEVSSRSPRWPSETETSPINDGRSLSHQCGDHLAARPVVGDEDDCGQRCPVVARRGRMPRRSPDRDPSTRHRR